MKEYHKSLQAYEQGLPWQIWQCRWLLHFLPVQRCNQSHLLAVEPELCRIEAGP